MFDNPIRMETKGVFESLSFYQQYFRLNFVFKEMIEELGFKVPLWLEWDTYYLLDKLEEYD